MGAGPTSHSLQFVSDAGSADESTFTVTDVRGREAISEPYRFDIELISANAEVDFNDLVENTARLIIKQPLQLGGDTGRWGLKALPWNGVVEEFEQLEQTVDFTRYRVTLRPKLVKLMRNTQSQIFQDMDIQAIITKVLEDMGLADGTDFEFRTNATYPTTEYVCQYDESDFDFISRWMEHFGIFYFFEQTDTEEKIVFGDSTSAYQAIPAPDTLSYNAAGGDGEQPFYRDPVLNRFGKKQQRIPKKVKLSDYNWRTPTDDLTVELEFGEIGEGMIYEYNYHYKTKDDGEMLAGIRKEEFLCREKVFPGVSDCRSFKSGHTFTVENHYRGEFNASYLLMEVEHKASQEASTASAGEAVTGDSQYTNSFTAIPADVVFRPVPEVEWPSIRGCINATIDAAGSGDYAEIDDMGRYKVILPFDQSGNADGKASRFVRMMQPYSGGGMGMHFPLHKGTEVLLGFIDGDPDRPAILGSIPNPDTASPVTGGNQSQCVINTGGQNRIEIEDNDGAQRIHMSSPTESTTFTMGAE